MIKGSSHQVRFCELRGEGKLVVGARRNEDQLQLEGGTLNVDLCGLAYL